MEILSSLKGIKSLCERLAVERLLINSEVCSLRELNNEICSKFLQLGLLSWNNKQHQLLLQRLVNSHSCISQDNTCAVSSQLNCAEFEEAYRRLGHHHADVARCFSILFDSPPSVAEILHAIGLVQDISSDDSIHAVFSLIYGNCIFPNDEKIVLQTLSCLIRVQLLSHTNPRLIIRKGTAAFPRLYKLYSESLYAAKIFLTAALHDSVMLVLCQDEVFLDIDPAKSPLRFPSADRIRRFGDDPTSVQYHKRIASHRKLIVEKLVLLAHSFIKGICDAIPSFPLGLIWLVQQLNSALIEVKQLPVSEATLICTDLIVTNLLCPAIINPENIGIISDTPISHIARFNLMQIGQIIQTLALSRNETPQPHFQIFASQFRDSPICDIVGSLLSHPIDSLDSMFPPVLCESHKSRELYCRPYFMGSLAEVNTVVSILHSCALDSVSSNQVKMELGILRTRIPKSFSTNSTVLERSITTDPVPLKQNKPRILTDKAHNSLSNSSCTSMCTPRLPQECFDVIVFHMEAQCEPVGLISEDKYMETIGVGGAIKKHVSGGAQKRTRFVGAGSTIGSVMSDRTDNASDLEDAVEHQEVGSILSSLEAPQEDRMLLLDDDGASTIPDNVSDVDGTGLSGQGSASLDGRESPLSQARSQCLRDGQENEIGDLGAVSTVAGSENDAAQRVLPSGVPVAVRKQNAEGLEEKFGKFTVPTLQQNSRDDQRSLLSDSWSTNVVPSDDEGTSLPNLPHLASADIVEASNHRGRSVNRTGSLCGTCLVPEDRSDTWSLDAIASDSEVDGGSRLLHPNAPSYFHVPDDSYDVVPLERSRISEIVTHAAPSVNVQPSLNTSNHLMSKARLRRHSSGSSLSYSRSEADSEISKDDRERIIASVSLIAARAMTKKQPTSEQAELPTVCNSTLSSPSHSSSVGNPHDIKHCTLFSPSNSSRKKFTLFQQGLQKVGDKMRKGMAASSFRQISYSSTISDILSDWNYSRKDNETEQLAMSSSQSDHHIDVVHRSADEILAKYQPVVSSFSNDGPTEQNFSASECASEQCVAYYSPENVKECRAFLDAKRKLRQVLCRVGNLSCMSFDGTYRGMKLENEREQLGMLLRALLAEAVNNREQSLVAHTREVIRCLQIFDNKGIHLLLRTLREENRKRSSYLLYLQQSRVTLLRLTSYIDKLMLRIQREKALAEECLVEVLVRFYLENKDQQMKRFLQEFIVLNAQDEKTDCLQRTLAGMYARLPISSMWQSAPAHLIVYARKTIERVFMAQIHVLAFYPNLDADRHRDELFSKSLARLSRTIHPSHPMLKIPTVLHGEAPWPSAQAEISIINAYKSARDKLGCVVRCCETISNLISMAPGTGPAAADDVTPVLVYVLIQANPPSLLSNVQYVQGFGGSLLDGIEGYWWTQFTAAIEFIKTLL